MAAQEQANRTKYIRKVIDNEDIDSKCRLCGGRDETVAHILAECWHSASIRTGDMIKWHRFYIGKFVRSMGYQQVRNGMIIVLKLSWKKRSHSDVGYENTDRQRD